MRLVPGASGSALAIWRDTRTDIGYYALRIGPGLAAAAGFPANGVFVYGNANGKQAPYVASDSSGGAFVMWGELVTATVVNGRTVVTRNAPNAASDSGLIAGIPDDDTQGL